MKQIAINQRLLKVSKVQACDVSLPREAPSPIFHSTSQPPLQTHPSWEKTLGNTYYRHRTLKPRETPRWPPRVVLACHPSDPTGPEERNPRLHSPSCYSKDLGNLDLKTPSGHAEGAGTVWEAAGKLLPCVLQTGKKWCNEERGPLPPYLTLQLFHRNAHSVSPCPCPGSRVTRT